jgi:catechol 2,3-dioxygenase-like lactoylglutathione lyase family enzyme
MPQWRDHYSLAKTDMFAKGFSSFSVPDIDAAEEFYRKTLGLTVEKRPEGLDVTVGDGHVFIYPSPTNKPAEFTVLNFIVEDIESTVDELTAKGVHFEEYDLGFAKTNEKGIASASPEAGVGPRAMAWLKDPAGNIIGIIQEK